MAQCPRYVPSPTATRLPAPIRCLTTHPPAAFQRMAMKAAPLSDAQVSSGLGLELAKKGIWALEKADLFNLLCIPPFTRERGAMSARQRVAPLLHIARDARAMYIVDSLDGVGSKPDGFHRQQPGLIWFAGWGLAIIQQNAAMYFPYLRLPDPFSENRLATSPRVAQWPGSWPAPTASAAYGKPLQVSMPHLPAWSELTVQAHRWRKRPTQSTGSQLPAFLPGHQAGSYGAHAPYAVRINLPLNGNICRCGVRPYFSKKACSAAPNGWCSNRMMNRCGRRYASISAPSCRTCSARAPSRAAVRARLISSNATGKPPPRMTSIWASSISWWDSRRSNPPNSW